MPDASAWKRRSIYQIITDRFAIGDHDGTPPAYDIHTRKYCGGTWQGIISKLDYIQGMGFDAIWISPVTQNIEEHTRWGQAYHGYWQNDIYSVNPHFGTAKDLLALSDALHTRGMYLMVDIVINHMGSTETVDYSRYVPFNKPLYYHSETFVSNYDNQTNVEQGWLGDNNVPLPDLDTEHPIVIHTLHAWITSLVRNFHIDGLRLDTVKHVRKNFWPDFIKAAGVWSLGEVLTGDPDSLGGYQPYVGGLLDYGSYYHLKRAFDRAGGSMFELANLLQLTYRAKYADTQQLGTFMENHDMPRFPHDTNSDQNVIKNSLSWTILSDGVPIVYYGQEQCFSGDGDPGSREPMWISGYQITPLYHFIARLNEIRKLSWDSGFGSSLTSVLYVDVNIIATQKGPVLMVLSNQGSSSVKKTITIPTKFPAGTVMVDILTSQSISIKKSTTIIILNGQPQIYLPYPLATQICPNIIPPRKNIVSKMLSTLVTTLAPPTQPRKDISSWSSGIPVVTSDILKPSFVRDTSWRSETLRPSSATDKSIYSIFL